MGSKKQRNKGKLDRSGSVSIGGTTYNVHPNVQQCMHQMYREGMMANEQLKKAVEFGEKQVKLLDKGVIIFDPMEIGDDGRQWIKDVNDLMKEMNPEAAAAQADVEEGPQPKPEEPTTEEEDARHNDVPGEPEGQEDGVSEEESVLSSDSKS